MQKDRRFDLTFDFTKDTAYAFMINVLGVKLFIKEGYYCCEFPLNGHMLGVNESWISLLEAIMGKIWVEVHRD